MHLKIVKMVNLTCILQLKFESQEKRTVEQTQGRKRIRGINKTENMQ